MAKPPHERTRPRLGDVVEIRLPSRKLAYVQYVNEHRDPPVYGSLLRVLPGKFTTRPERFSEHVAGPELYYVFFPLGAACARGYLKIVANEPIPERCRDWPLLKGYNENFNTRKKTWFLWNGGKSRKIDELEEKYYDCSMHEVVNLTALEDRIDSGWMPRDEVPPGPPRGMRR